MYRIHEFPDVLADACLRDSEGRFLFISLYGRDGAILQMLSAMELSETKGGIDRFNIVDDKGRGHVIDIGDTGRLAKFTGRLPRQNIFGPLTHTWLYDQAILKPDLANRQAWVLTYDPCSDGEDARVAMLEERCWRAIQSLSPVPLLPAWRDAVMSWCFSSGAVRYLDDPLYPPVGPIRGARVGLGTAFLDQISHLVKSRQLQLDDQREDLAPAPTQPVATCLKLGAIVHSEGVEALLVDAPGFLEGILQRHHAMDCGDISEDDRVANLLAASVGGRVVSRFSLPDCSEHLIVFTDLAQQVTTVMLASEVGTS
jgi:hypothetical protein